MADGTDNGAAAADRTGPEPGPTGVQMAGRPVLGHSEVGLQGRRKALLRLRSARGHLDGVLRMLETDRYCVDVLHQLAAVEGALARARREILEAHLRGCVVDANCGVEQAVEEALAALGGRAPAPRTEGRTVL